MNISSYFFLNEENIRFNNQCLNTYIGYPQPISKDWPNLLAGFQRYIDDIINLTRILDKKLTRSLFQEQSFGVHQKQLRGGNRLWTT
ncbi:hypothetical protein [Photorhabdus laumondii]|uniref:hypothetical protein n=1 Tax=Photorhabdus laumondii TaxID=2218628 RepID=UPI0002D8175D|nr:hypothetical protein [Photorhabdus laumondii]AWK41494.1 hypothetical protein A4R40_08325 [Photorhabdus laumondii subsp. laumondii]